ncbi:MAG: hypothetical protein KAI24_04015 [Planctomycetes bacterium]|nr:hypothetical protein [Planctomycetota bacterium]
MAAKTTTASPRKKAAKKAKTAKAPAAKSKTPARSSAAKSPAKKAAKKAPARKAAKKASAASAVATPPAARRSRKAAPERSIFLPRAVASVDDDDPLMAHGGGGGGFGRCGGRLLSNRLEQQLCHRLGIAGVVHSHSPRHYEIRYSDEKVAAYAPMIVLRGRGREGKGVVIEAVEDPKAAILKKITAFRAQYGQEFYVILVADEDSLDEIPLSAYDESCSASSVHTLIARLAE